MTAISWRVLVRARASADSIRESFWRKELAHGGNPSLADYGENGPAQHCGVGVERGAPRNGDVITPALWLRGAPAPPECPIRDIRDSPRGCTGAPERETAYRHGTD
jgi:hypothetical protein